MASEEGRTRTNPSFKPDSKLGRLVWAGHGRGNLTSKASKDLNVRHALGSDPNPHNVLLLLMITSHHRPSSLLLYGYSWSSGPLRPYQGLLRRAVDPHKQPQNS